MISTKALCRISYKSLDKLTQLRLGLDLQWNLSDKATSLQDPQRNRCNATRHLLQFLLNWRRVCWESLNSNLSLSSSLTFQWRTTLPIYGLFPDMFNQQSAYSIRIYLLLWFCCCFLICSCIFDLLMFQYIHSRLRLWFIYSSKKTQRDGRIRIDPRCQSEGWYDAAWVERWPCEPTQNGLRMSNKGTEGEG